MNGNKLVGQSEEVEVVPPLKSGTSKLELESEARRDNEVSE